jgi:hypothetical protein
LYSITYEKEKGKLIRHKISIENVRQICAELWKNGTVRTLIKKSGDPLDEYVQIFLGIYGEQYLTQERFLRFFTSLMSFRQEIKDYSALIKSYEDMNPEDLAAPLQAITEIVGMVAIAVLSGASTTIVDILIKKFLEGRKDKKTDSLVRLILSSPIPSLLLSSDKGLSTEEICEKANMEKEEATYFLMNFKSRGWIISESKEKQSLWKLNLDKIIKDF